ncbi:OmpA family protein [Magnetospirillum sp. XM-1]|uniref:OmpA family protein n=1 Tax=Magnetospirillum sp. XM-1 TaxID=1663591 RepID=UPI0008381C11|nr:OmpA family protein [Magnetospirillum sp. XM-1]
MTDSRRDFLLRFAATALAAAGAGCDSPVEALDEPLARREQPLAVYGPPARRDRRTSLLEIEVNFTDGGLDLDAQARTILDGVAETLKRDPEQPVILEGHADQRGSREYNLAVGDRRAQVVRQYLIERGIHQNRITAISFGQERPKDAGRTKAAMAANRRVVIRLEPY